MVRVALWRSKSPISMRSNLWKINWRYPRNVAPCGGNDLKSEQRRRSRQSKSQIENSEVTSQKKNRKKQLSFLEGTVHPNPRWLCPGILGSILVTLIFDPGRCWVSKTSYRGVPWSLRLIYSTVTVHVQYIYSTFTVHHSGPNFEIFGARFPAVDGSKVDLARQHITLACRLPMHWGFVAENTWILAIKPMFWTFSRHIPICSEWIHHLFGWT